MVHKYGSWWNVGVAQTALSERIRKVAQMINEKRARRVITKTNLYPESYRLTEKTIMSLKLGVIGAGAIGKEHIRRCTQPCRAPPLWRCLISMPTTPARRSRCRACRRKSTPTATT